MATQLKQTYKETVVGELMNKLQLKNPMQVPRLEKIVINVGLGAAARDKNILRSTLEELALIAGQQPSITRARKSIAGFNIREGWPIGCKVTLRGERMYEFFERLIHVAIPRVRDFRGFSAKSFDGRGNLSIGIKEQIIFPEIDYDKVSQLYGLDITVVTSTDSDDQARELITSFNFPFKD